jgi:phosphatidylglycerophosphatase A
MTINKKMLLTDVRGWIATGFGSGLAPVAPGTFGTVAALPILFFLSHQFALWQYAVFLFGLFAMGCWASQFVIDAMHLEDPGLIVIDEWVGMGIAWAVVAYWPKPHSDVIYLLPAFLIFRLCDIFKPWPASWADRQLSGGFGAMTDDALAGLWAALALALMLGFNVLPNSL